jgi:DNA-binding NarL/FixJ family response regulator
MTQPVRVIIVDDHPIWRDALERDLTDAGYQIVGSFGDGEAAIRTLPATRPDVAVLDVQLPGMSGPLTAAGMVSIDPSLRVLMFSASGEDADVLEAVKRGARGYLTKSAPRAELLDAIARTADGQAVFGPGLAALVLGEHRRLERDQRETKLLTERETEILRLVSTGMTAKQIADQLRVSPRTVQNHVQNTLRKLQLRNRVELTRWAIDQGLTE